MFHSASDQSGFCCRHVSLSVHLVVVVDVLVLVVLVVDVEVTVDVVGLIEFV